MQSDVSIFQSELLDPIGDRNVPELQPPPNKLLTVEELFNEQLNVTELKTFLGREGRLSKECILKILQDSTDVFHTEPNLLNIKDPVTVVGDIHGQYYDLLKLLELGGEPSLNVQYVFLGDYVDRGSYSTEVVILLYAYKLLFPKNIWLLRGNHECRQMTSFFNFRNECEHKYDIDVFDAFMESFDSLPIGAIINGQFLCVHGGLSPEFIDLQQAQSIHRFQEPPREGLFCDLLWSDPTETYETDTSNISPYNKNGIRGCAWFFTYEATMKFLNKNNLLSLIRAHEAQIEGYKMHKTCQSTGFPSVITIFSAPNYCDVYNNKGAILKFHNTTLNIQQFNVSPHPYYLPDFMSVFQWSLPFVIEKVTEILMNLLQVPDGEEEELLPELPKRDKDAFNRHSLSMEQNEAVYLATMLENNLRKEEEKPLIISSTGNDTTPDGPVMSKDKSDRLRRKVRTVARMARMFKTLREEHETVVKLKGLCPANRIKPGLLVGGKLGLQTELEQFEVGKRVDLENEKRPTEDQVSQAIAEQKHSV